MSQSNDLVMATTKDLILKLWGEHPSWSNGKIADEVRRRKPDARTTAASVSSTLSRAIAEDAAARTGDAGGVHGFRQRTKTLAMPLTNDLILELSEEHPSWSNGQIADEVRCRKPSARTTAASVSSTKSRASPPGATPVTGETRDLRRSGAVVRPRAPVDTDPRELRSMIESGESARLEFKSTARRNLHTREKDQRMTTAVVKTITAFMNTEGGTLLIGVDDAGRAVGIEEDYPFVKKNDRDGWLLFLTNEVIDVLGVVAWTDLRVEFCTLDDRTIACIEVHPGAEPTFASLKDKQQPVFFARLNNSTRELWGQELLSYQRKRWPG